MGRSLTKKHRTLLWIKSDGLCSECGCEIDHSFHADHYNKPWSVFGKTNVHDMRAVCPACNIRRGNKMMRTHQKLFTHVMGEWRFDKKVGDIFLEVTPGGGKSAIPPIALHYAVDVDKDVKVCWVVPRRNLATQAERSFMDAKFRDLLGHANDIRHSTNDINPSRGTGGYVTTYDAIRANPDLHHAEFERHRYILVLDEPHHIELDGETAKAIAPLCGLAILRVFMSGTFERWDGKRIFGVPYVGDDRGQVKIDYSTTPTRRWIRYGLRAALAEKAVIPMYFERIDGTASWKDSTGCAGEVKSFRDASGQELQRAIYTAISTDYANALLHRSVEHWKACKDNRNPRAKLLVIAPRIEQAKRYHKWLLQWGIKAGIATSEDPEAEAEIQKLKVVGLGSLDALVTVAMAYEGMDCPPVTHIAFLTHIRSKPWIMQALARATRVDYPAGSWESQEAHIFAPDDEFFSEAIKQIRLDQDAVLTERDNATEDSQSRDGETREPGIILPLGSMATDVRATDWDDPDGISGEEYQAISAAAKLAGLEGIPISKLRQFFDMRVRYNPNEQKTSTSQRTDRTSSGKTHSQREADLRQNISAIVNQHCRGNGEAIRHLNWMMIKQFGKKRSELSLDELENLWIWLTQEGAMIRDQLGEHGLHD